MDALPECVGGNPDFCGGEDSTVGVEGWEEPARWK